MEGSSKDHFLSNFELHKESLRALFAREEAAKQAIRDHLDHTAYSDDEEDESIEPLSTKRIDSIVQLVSSHKSTWPKLRQQYLPSQSCLAPFNIAVNGKDAPTDAKVARLVANLAVDTAYCQAATMSAYGVDLLHSALEGTLVDRGAGKAGEYDLCNNVFHA
ncbi:hypothetical protein H4218_006238 [Coemansia sp. IMI 209128]|nr:hypothetical protein H4218_006238 [Coemansia sp. IMI 209128]